MEGDTCPEEAPGGWEELLVWPELLAVAQFPQELRVRRVVWEVGLRAVSGFAVSGEG